MGAHDLLGSLPPMLQFTIPLAPEPQRRAKIVKVGKFSRLGRTKAQEEAEGLLVGVLAHHRPPEPMQGPLSLQVIAYLPTPKSMSKKKKLEAAEGKLLPIKKPDLSNLMKHLEDCMTKMSFYNDDAQIVHSSQIKLYDDGKGPRWVVRLNEYVDGGR